MRKAYMAPKLSVLCFAPVERLAALPAEEYAQLLGGSPSAQDVSVDTPVTNNPEGDV